MLWCTAEYSVDFCKRKAKELRKTGKYKKVSYRKTCRDYAGDGKLKDFGKIYVYPKEAVDNDRASI